MTHYSKLNWSDKEIDEVYDILYDEVEEPDQYPCFVWLMEHYPDLDIEWDEIFEDFRAELPKKEGRDALFAFAKWFKENRPQDYSERFEFIERELCDYYFYKNDLDKLQERVEFVAQHPVTSIDTLTKRLLFQLIYNGHYDKAINYAQAVWRPLKKSENLINYPEHPFVNTLYIKDLQECYLASLEHKNFDKDAFLDKIVSMGFDEDKGQIDKVIDTLKSDLPLGDIKDGLLIKPQEQLLILNIHFLKYMYNTYQMPFIFSEWLWNIIATTSIFGKQKGAENWFYVDCATLDQHIAEKYDTFFSANQLELFGQVWGLDFVFEFLHSSKLLSDEHYHNMLENISFLKNEMIRIVGINLWQMQFVKNWPNANNSSVDPSLQPLFDDSFNLEDDDAIERINSYSSKAPVSERAQDELKKGKNKRNKENDYEPLPLLNDDWGSEEYQKKEPVINTEPKVPVINTEPKVSVINTEPKVGRNEPCPCGSGKKYKKCCLNK